MVNKDLVKKKRTVNLDTATYERLSKFTGSLREASGGFVSMNAAVAVLLDGWKELERIANNDVPCFTSEGQVMGQVTTGFIEQYFIKPENEMK